MTRTGWKRSLATLLAAVVLVVSLCLPVLTASTQSAAASYVPRLTAPDESSPYYSSKNVYYLDGYGMPNCTCYAWGRAYEILGTQPNLPQANAGDWFALNAQSGAYTYGSKPALGAIICWGHHVAVVEAVSDSQITISESHASGTMFDVATVYVGSEGTYTSDFLGYIYILGNAPAGSAFTYVPSTVTTTTSSTTDTTTGSNVPSTQTTTAPQTTTSTTAAATGMNGAFVKGNDGRFYYYENGEFQSKLSTIVKATLNGTEGWYIVKNGVFQNWTTIYPGQGAWWYCENGKVDFTVNDVKENSLGWWKVTNGKVDFQYTGVARNENGWWRIENGKVNFAYNGLASNPYGSWVIEKGKAQLDYNGQYLWKGVYYNIQNGKVV